MDGTFKQALGIVVIVGLSLLICTLIYLLVKHGITEEDAVLEIDDSGDEKDIYKFVFLKPIEDIPKMNYLKVKVVKKSDSCKIRPL